MRKYVYAVMALVLLSGCASQAARDSLATAQSGCSQGIAEACSAVPYAQQQVQIEEAENGDLVIAAILIPLVIVAAIGGAQQPSYGGGHGFGGHHGYGGTPNYYHHR